MARVPNLIMGTAGHVDHGKTTLVKTLTGTDLDTLEEEKARGLTINLGFTHFDTPSGNRIGIVDVPGHRRFIKTMLAGAHGIDFVLLLIACDDSVMPQTREHLYILRLLGIEHGIVVLTKTDLVEPELIELVEAEASELAEGSFLEKAPMIRVSAATGEGIPELVAAIDDLAGSMPPRERGGYFRIFADRVFTVPGAGTVITGTALSGSVSPGDELEILPRGGLARVRKIEIHGETSERARAGQRSAINLRMVDRSEVEKGDMLATPGIVVPTYMLDARLEILPDYPRPVRHWTRIRLYLGAAECFGRIVLLDLAEIRPGDSAYVQIRLESPAPAVTGDLFIVRDFSAHWTIGGGRILDAHPVKHKRKRALVVNDLATREEGYLEEVLELEVKKAGYFISRDQAANSLDTPLDRTGAAAASLAKAGRVILLPPKKSPSLIHREGWDRLVKRITKELKAHHQALPQLESGIAEQELRERLERATGALLPAEAFRHALERLVQEGMLREVDSTYALSEHTASLAETDEAALASIRAMYAVSPMSPPATEEAYAKSGLPTRVVRDFLERMVERGELVRVSREFMFERSALEKVEQKLLRHLAEHGRITVSEFREVAGTSRKYAIPLLNWFDSRGVTRREGDFRVEGHRSKG